MIDNSLKKLIINARDGDNEEFDALVYKIKDDLFRIAKSRLLDENDASDAVQETIITMYRLLPELKKTSSFKTWIVKILINKCNDIYNNRHVNESISLDDEFNVNKVYTIDKNINEEYEIFKVLDEEERTLITLFFIEGYKSKEIAKMFNMNMNTVKTKILRAKNKMRKEIEKRREDYE